MDHRDFLLLHENCREISLHNISSITLERIVHYSPMLFALLKWEEQMKHESLFFHIA
jgi:hypothetical protein